MAPRTRWLLASLLLPLVLAPATLRLVRIVGDSDAPVLPDGAHAVFLVVAYDVRVPFTDLVLSSHADPVPGELILFHDPGGNLATKHVASPPGPVDGVWVDGRNPDQSRDSRHYGAVDRDDVLGRLIFSW